MGHIQIRNVPPELHRRLKARAAEQGLSLSDYVLRVVERNAASLSAAEVLERIRAHGAVTTSRSGADLVREARDLRERELQDAAERRR